MTRKPSAHDVPPRVLVLCPGVWDREALRGRASDGYQLEFHGAELLETPSIVTALRWNVFRWVDEAAARFRHEGISGIVGVGDYPGCMLAALVAEALRTPAPRPRAVVQLSHKYYSRVLQRAVVPEAVPDFEPIDPFARRPRPRLGYPLFIKPVKGTMSIRATMVHDAAALRRAVAFPLRERIEKHLLLRPFGQLVRRYTDATVPSHWFIGESPLRGVQVTVDGFVQHGRATVMGVVDSVMYPGTQSFARFDYPSQLPNDVQERMSDIARRLMEGVGFDASCFNIEMFWDEATGAIRVIEINPRMSYQFADLFERVDGTNSYSVQLALATGRPALWRRRAGSSAAAASFVPRLFADAAVVRVPSSREIAQLGESFPGTSVKVLCEPGRRLAQYDQDMGSYRYAIVNMGASSRDELMRTWSAFERAWNPMWRWG